MRHMLAGEEHCPKSGLSGVCRAMLSLPRLFSVEAGGQYGWTEKVTVVLGFGLMLAGESSLS
jgi:hypothetical protein